MAPPCLACTHPARELIDNFYEKKFIISDSGDVIRTAKHLSEYLAVKYPNDPTPSESGLSTHNSNLHGKVPPKAVTAYRYRGGKILTPEGKVLEEVPPTEYLRAIVTFGYYRLLEDPSRLTPTQVIEAIGMLKKLNANLGDETEAKDAWEQVLQAKIEAETIEGKCEVIE